MKVEWGEISPLDLFEMRAALPEPGPKAVRPKNWRAKRKKRRKAIQASRRINR